MRIWIWVIFLFLGLNAQGMNAQKTILHKLHLIWVGGELPQGYLRSLCHYHELAWRSGFDIYLWLDREIDLLKAIDRQEKAVALPHLRLSTISSLFSEAKKRVVQHKTLYRVEMIAAREGIGFHNHAARADIYRYLILFIEGGIYIDIDIGFKFDKEAPKFDANELITTHGIKLKSSIFPLKYIDGKYTMEKVSINNDIMASIPGHFIMQDVLDRMLEKYHHLDKQLFFLNNHRFSLNDVKRSGRNDFAQGHELKFPIRGFEITGTQWPRSS